MAFEGFKTVLAREIHEQRSGMLVALALGVAIAVVLVALAWSLR